MTALETWGFGGIKGMTRFEITELQEIPNVGPAIVGNLVLLGITKPGDLIGRDPYQMYDLLCQITGKRHDPCVIDVFISAVRFMEGEQPEKWWHYTAERKRFLLKKI